MRSTTAAETTNTPSSRSRSYSTRARLALKNSRTSSPISLPPKPTSISSPRVSKAHFPNYLLRHCSRSRLRSRLLIPLHRPHTSCLWLLRLLLLQHRHRRHRNHHDQVACRKASCQVSRHRRIPSGGLRKARGRTCPCRVTRRERRSWVLQARRRARPTFPSRVTQHRVVEAVEVARRRGVRQVSRNFDQIVRMHEYILGLLF